MSSQHKALFLDRDGIINVDTKYLHKINDFMFVHGIFDLVKLFSKKGYKIFVVTNQSGIGRGYYGLDDFRSITKWMLSEFEKEDIVIDAVKFCPHLPSDFCVCRKPNIGMIEEILEEHDIDLSSSWMIGDKSTDVRMAYNAGIGKVVFIGDSKEGADYEFASIIECKNFIKNNKDLI